MALASSKTKNRWQHMQDGDAEPPLLYQLALVAHNPAARPILRLSPCETQARAPQMRCIQWPVWLSCTSRSLQL
jgi:hypothetical protein